MALIPEFSLAHSKFNDFLFAFVGEEKTGAQLTVLSALARLDIDPWKEAARLSELPREAATRALDSTIAALPEGNWKVSDSRSIATRLVAYLPKKTSPRAQPLESHAIDDRKPTSAARRWLLRIVLLAAALVLLASLFGE